MTIILNGKERELPAWKKLTYDQIVTLAHGPILDCESPVFTVTYWRPRHSRMPFGLKPGSGSLVQGEEVKLTSRMVFNCASTARA